MAEDRASTPGPTKEAGLKRKRLDARVFKQQWTLFSAKKKKAREEFTPEIKHGKLDSSHSTSESSRIGSEVKSQPGNVEAAATLEQSAKSVPKGCEQASSSTDDLLPGLIHGGRIEDAVFGAKDRSEYPADFMTKLPRYIEYWVPVALSYVQLEKYCETLLKSSMFLCSSLKNEVLDSLHEILITIRKSCDHPYLVDSALQEFVKEGRPVGDYMSNGIEASGKLFLLGKLLEEVKRKHLRVLIVFQSNDSTSRSINLQHFLDDLVCVKVGEGCFVNIFREFDSSQKRAAVDLFNDKENGKLVMLIEKSACQSNIKLSSMDCVILFNSDLSPINDMKSLRRMSIRSKFDHLKVFRFYSSYSVEEKALTLAKEGTALESGFRNIGHNACHMLLLWGTSYLFSKLDDFHSHCSSIADLKCLSEDKLAFDVVNEISRVLSCEDNDISSCLLISKVREADNDYSQNIVLHGEKDEPLRDDDLPPFTVWASLLDGRNPLWKLLPGSSERIRRRGGISISSALYVEYSNSAAKMVSKRTAYSVDEFHCPKPRARKVCRPAPGKGAGTVAGPSKSHGNSGKSISCGDDSCGPSTIEETCMRRMRELVLKQKEGIREFYSAKRKAREKLEEEHQSEVNLMNKRYKEETVEEEQLKNLYVIYEQKVEEHNRQMDRKRQDLEAEHLTSRMNEKKLKDKLFALLNTEDHVLMKLSLLETPLGQQTVGSTEKFGDSGIMRSNAAPLLETEGSQEVEHVTANVSMQRDDLGSPPDQVLTDTEIFSVESEEGNVRMSTFREEVCDTADCDIEMLGELNCEDDMRGATDSGTSVTLDCQKRIEEVGDGNCNNKALPGPSNEESEMSSATEGTQQMIEELLVGDYNIEDHSGASTGVAAMKDDMVLGTSITMDAQERIEEMQDAGCNLEAHIRASNDQSEVRAAGDSGTTMVGKQRVEEMKSGGVFGASNGEAARRGVTDLVTNPTVVVQQRVEEAQSGPIEASNTQADMRGVANLCIGAFLAAQQRVEEAQDMICNIEAAVGGSNGEVVMRGAGESGSAAAVAVLVEELIESPSRLNDGSEAMMQSQTCSMTGNSTPLEQSPVVSSNIPCNEIRPTTGTSDLLNSNTSRVPSPCQPGYTPAPFSNIRFCDQPAVQSRLQSAAGWAHPHISSSNSIANNYFQEPSSRYNQIPSARTDPFQFELDRIKGALEELDMVYADKNQHLESNCAKEKQEIENKYTLLRMESKNELVQKKLEMENIYKKVEANKLLAETLKSSKQKQILSSISQEDLRGAILEMYPMQLNLPTQTTSLASTTPSPQLLPQPPVQVREFFELVTFDNSRPQNLSPLPNSENPDGYQACSSAPHLRSMRAVSPPASNILTSFDGIMNQQAGVWSGGSVPRLYQMGFSPSSQLQLGGTPQNPVLL